MFVKMAVTLKVNGRIENQMEKELNSSLMEIFWKKVFGLMKYFNNEVLIIINLYINV